MPAMKCELDMAPLATIPTEIKETVVHKEVSSGPLQGISQTVDFVFKAPFDPGFEKMLFASKIGSEVMCKTSVESHVLFMGSVKGRCGNGVTQEIRRRTRVGAKKANFRGGWNKPVEKKKKKGIFAKLKGLFHWAFLAISIKNNT